MVNPSTAERLTAAVTPVLARLGLRCYDVEVVGSGRSRTLRILVDRDGGVDLKAITAATEALGPVLDDDPAVAQVLPGTYLLEVSSPGLERPLRTPEHFRGAVGTPISLKVRTPDGSTRRDRAVVTAVDDAAVEVDIDGTRARFPYGEIVQARTVFEWDAAPRPGGPRRSPRRAAPRSKATAQAKTRTR